MRTIIAVLAALMTLVFSPSLSAKESGDLIPHLTKSEFLKKVYNYQENPDDWKFLGDKPVIVDFYATWCPPCKKMAPVLDELAKKYGDDIIIYKVDIDKEADLARHFKIQSVPTLYFVPMKGDPKIEIGGKNKEELVELIEKVLLKK